MDLNQYQEAAKKTAVFPKESALIYLAMGMAAEAGETVGPLAKIYRGDKTLTEELKYSTAKELGDVLWFIALLADELGFTLKEIGEMNIEKLASRAAKGTLKGDGDNR